MLLLLTLACQPATPSWDLFTPVAVSQPAASAEEGEPELSDEFAEAMAIQEAAENPWGIADDPEEVEVEPEAEEVVEAAPEPVVQAAVQQIAPPPVVSTPSPVGQATQPAWGVRLVGTLHNAQPPRAALGLPSGEEVVVSAGAMLQELGIIVVSVGPNSVQLAKVTPSGDHATIEPMTLTAQYATGVAGVQP